MARRAAPPAPSRSTVPAQPPFAPDSIIWEKRAGLPVWGWAGLVLLVLLGVAWWRNRTGKSGSSTSSSGVTSTTTGGGTGSTGSNTGGGGGTTTTPGDDPGSGDDNTTPPDSGSPPPTTTPPAPSGGWVTVTKWPDNTAPKESTLWDIAAAWLPEGANNWGLIWNNSMNADVKALRKNPDLIRAGDKFWVPNKLASPRG